MKNNRTFLEKLLDGAEVEWKPLSLVTEMQRGKTITAKSANEGKIPVISGGQKPAYYHSESNRDGKTITVAGSGAYAGYIMYWEEPIFVSDAFSIKTNESLLQIKYVYHFLLQNQQKIHAMKKGSGVPHVYPKDIGTLMIPIPPLPVQTEIVKILDALTALTSELTSELTLRRKQYEYYREKLLSHDSSEYSTQKSDKVKFFHTSNIQWLHLNEIYKFQYGIGNKIPTIGGEYPVYGSNGIVGTHNEYNSENAPVIGHIGAYAGIVNWAEGKHFVTYNGIICNKINDNVNSRYAYYLLLSQNFIDKANKASQPFISYDILNKCIVPVPPLEEQQRIVSILDKFEALTNSITEGLPLAIEQSQKRYEYYRELLLSF